MCKISVGSASGQRHLGGTSQKKLNTSQRKCKSSLKITILRCVFDLGIDFDRKFTITYAPRQNRGSQEQTMGAIPYRQDPYSSKLFGEK